MAQLRQSLGVDDERLLAGLLGRAHGEVDRVPVGETFDPRAMCERNGPPSRGGQLLDRRHVRVRHVAVLPVRALHESARGWELPPLAGVQVVLLRSPALVQTVEVHEVQEQQRLLVRARSVEEQAVLVAEPAALDAGHVRHQVERERIQVHVDVREDRLAQRVVALLERAEELEHREPAVRRHLERAWVVREREVVVAPVFAPEVQHPRAPGRHRVDVAPIDLGELLHVLVVVRELRGRDRWALGRRGHVGVHIECEAQEVERVRGRHVCARIVRDAHNVLAPAVVAYVIAHVRHTPVSPVLLEPGVLEPVHIGLVQRPDVHVVEPCLALVAAQQAVDPQFAHRPQRLDDLAALHPAVRAGGKGCALAEEVAAVGVAHVHVDRVPAVLHAGHVFRAAEGLHEYRGAHRGVEHDRLSAAGPRACVATVCQQGPFPGVPYSGGHDVGL